jgi:hypothetical protein
LLGPLAPYFVGAMEGSPRHSRAQAIVQYAKRRGFARWLALDDDPSVRTAAKHNRRFVPCDPAKGLSERLVQQRVAAFLAGGGRQ